MSHDVTLGEVRRFLLDEHDRYMAVLDHLTEIFRRYKFAAESRGAIYSVYSRKHKQGYSEFKEARKIVAAVNDKRNDKRKPQPTFMIHDVEDVIGITVVVAYPSDVDLIKDFVASQAGRSLIKIVQSKRKDEKGYKAHHYVLAMRDTRYANILCEVQIKTLLHDAWAAKTHDVVYKPRGFVDTRMTKQFNRWHTLLREADDASEELKDLIQEAWDDEDKRKEAARLSLLTDIHLPRAADPARNQKYDEWTKKLESRNYATGDLEELIKELDDFAKEPKDAPYDPLALKLFALLAVIRVDDDADDVALDAIRRGVLAAKDPEARCQAQVFKSLALYCFDRMDEAIEAAAEATDTAKKLADRTILVDAMLNQAYYLAETARSPKDREAKEAYLLMNKVLENCGGVGGLEPHQKDTVGFVKIVAAAKKREITEGLALCEQAQANNSDTSTAALFYDLAKRRARIRLQDLTKLPAL